jgi:N-acetylglucosaminyldiphosphoundecaprenol N-acetyl-beta-D-mannosaminyltransferase
MMNDIAVRNQTNKVVDLNISTLSYDEVVENIFSLADSRSSSYVCFANAHMAVEAHLNKKIADSVNEATIVTSDGMSVIMALKFLHKVKQARTAGMDMIFDVISGAEKHGFSIFLFGSDKSTLSLFKAKAIKDHPKLEIAGAIAPPYTEFTKEENDQFINEINNSGAKIIFVGLGCPKQEQWMAENHKRINAVMLGFGGAFSLYARKVKRAPVFMQKYCLEWLYRLAQEPRRLWKRYLVTNTLFIVYFFKQFFNKRRG